MGNLSFAFPEPLAERYQPRTIEEFVGLEKARKILGNFVSNPYPSAWLFIAEWSWQDQHGTSDVPSSGWRNASYCESVLRSCDGQGRQ